MALTDLTRISTSGIATGTSLSGAILHGDAHFRGTQIGVTSALFDSSDNALEFNDNVQLKFGNSGDLSIYHTGNNSIIKDQGTGSLSLQSNGTEIALYNSSNDKYMGKFANNAQVELYHAGNKKFETTQTGAVVTGVLTATTFSGPLIGSPINNPSGISTFYDLRVSNNLTVEGTTTTLDTNLIGVDRIEVGANSNSVVGVAITQSGTADILNLYDGSTEVFSVADGGNVTTTGTLKIANNAPSLIFDDQNHSIDFTFTAEANQFKLTDSSNGDRVSFNSTGSVSFSGGVVVVPSLQCSTNVQAEGNVNIGDSIVHIGDTNTKIRFPAADTFTVETGGSERLRITNNGLKVGTNVDNNYAVIHAHSSGTAARLHLTNANTGTTTSDGAIIMIDSSSNMEILNKENTNLEFFTNAIERLRIDSSGRVLIGGGSSPSQVGDGRLIVYANTRLHPAIKADCIDGGSNRANGFTLLADNYMGDESICNFGISYSGAGLVLSRGVKVSNTTDDTYLSSMDSFAMKPSVFKLDDSGDIIFLNTDTSATTTTDSAVTLYERLRITSDGDLGLGINNPARHFHLHVDSSAANYQTFTNSTTGATTNDGFLLGLSSSEQGIIWNYENTSLRIATNNTERLTITSGNGDVGISSTSPRARLDVKDANTGHPVILRVSADNATPYALIIGNDDHNTDANRGLGMWVGGSKTHHIQARTSATVSENKLEIEAYETTIQTGSNMNRNFVFDSSGRLLINGASSNNAFSGGDDLIIGNSSGSTRSGITIVSNSSQDGGLYFSDGTSSGNAHVQGQIVYEHDGNYLRLYTAASERIRIDSSGRLLVGAAAIQYHNAPFYVSGTGPVIGAFHSSSGGTNDQARIALGALANNPPYNRGVYLTAENNGAGHDFIVACSASHAAGPSEKLRINSAGNMGVGVLDPKSKLHLGSTGDIRFGSQYGGFAHIMQQMQYAVGYTGTHWQFETNNQMSWCFDGVLIVYGGGGSTYGSEVTKITIVYSRENGANNSGDMWRNGTTSYNVETLGHGQVGLNPGSGELTVTEDTAPDGAASQRSLLKLGWTQPGHGGATTIWSKLHGTFYWGTGSSGNVEIQDKDGTIVWNSNP